MGAFMLKSGLGFLLSLFLMVLSACGSQSLSEVQSLTLENVDYISVVVKDLKFTPGTPTQKQTQLCYAVFAGPEGFPNNPQKVVLKGCKPVDSAVVSFLVEGLPPSQDGYVLSLFQDMNLNGKLDTRSLFGVQIPDEPFGFSQNPPLTGVPSYEKCKIVPVKNGERFDISMRKIGG